MRVEEPDRMHTPRPTGLVLLAASFALALLLAGCGSTQVLSGPNPHVVKMSGTCYLTALGDVGCWGDNQFGELGNGVNASSSISNAPVKIVGLAGRAIDIAEGSFFNCALLQDRRVQCWGTNDAGELGQGDAHPKYSARPLFVRGLAPAKEIAASGDNVNDYGCALTVRGGVECWGRNDTGALVVRNKPRGALLTATYVDGLTSGVTSLSVDTDHACAVRSGGSVTCWGTWTRGGYGPLNDWTNLAPKHGVRAVSTDGGATCVLMDVGSVECWGYPATVESTHPTVVAGLSKGVRSVLLTQNVGCAVMDRGTVRCWGDDSEGELGNGYIDASVTFYRAVQVKNLPGAVRSVTELGAGTYAVLTGGHVVAWGGVIPIQIGNEVSSETIHLRPAQVF